MNNNPSVSVIIPAYNAARTLVRTIEAVRSQTVPPQEILIVDDGSTDQTPQLAQTFSDVRYLHQDNAGPATARNTGAATAKGEILFFTDSDCIPHRDWLEKGLSGFKEEKIGAVCGSYGIANPETRLARGVHGEILYRHHHLMPERPKAFGSYNFGVRRAVFEQVGGFLGQYRHASGEDNDLSYKILNSGYDIYFVRDCLVDHMHPERVGRYLKEQFRHGFWRAKMYLEHPVMTKGDDYTFWKDIVEVPWVWLIGLTALLSLFFHGIFLTVLAAAFLFLFCLEFCYSLVTSLSFLDAIFFSFVLFLRAFARCAGFSTGIPLFFCKNMRKKR